MTPSQWNFGRRRIKHLANMLVCREWAICKHITHEMNIVQMVVSQSSSKWQIGQDMCTKLVSCNHKKMMQEIRHLANGMHLWIERKCDTMGQREMALRANREWHFGPMGMPLCARGLWLWNIFLVAFCCKWTEQWQKQCMVCCGQERPWHKRPYERNDTKNIVLLLKRRQNQ